MDTPNDQDERSILLDIIKGIDELIVETHEQQTELESLLQDAISEHDTKQMSDFAFSLLQERYRRASDNVLYCLRGLSRQKKIALLRLSEL